VTTTPIIDLFAGAGGLGLAAMRAGGEPRLHVELDPMPCATLKANELALGGRVVEEDVTKLHGSDLRSLAGLSTRDPLVVIGGPPCQPFSKAAFWSEDGDDAAYRRARLAGENAPPPAEHGPREDSRRFLILEFIERVVESRADGFLFENVLSLIAPRNRPILDAMMSRASSAGYHMTLVRANAVEFGVPQRRERIFVLGSRHQQPISPAPTHSKRLSHESKLLPPVGAASAIASFAGEEYFEQEEVVTGRWAAHLEEVPPGWNYKALTEWAGHPAPTFVAETRFWNFLLKLEPDRPSWTIPANPGPWVGPFHWESRRLRTPELAAIQGFPPGYKFVGNRRQVVRQIGNAAPPPLASPMISSVLRASIRARRKVAACAV
jgi:DNA (cytosine-5)-methyltransferase 1